MGEYLRSWRSDFRSPVPIVVWLALSVIVGLAGPFGTYDLFPLWERMTFWCCVLAFAILCAMVVRSFVYRVLRLRSLLVGSIVVGTILGLSLPAAAVMMMPATLGPEHLVTPAYAELACFVFLTSLAVGAYRHMIGPGIAGDPSGSDAVLSPLATPQDAASAGDRPALVQPRLVRRLPEGKAGALISISVRDHYVDVVTRKGRASLLLRLSDAVVETDGVDGAQVHRSHWVAWDAVAGLDRSAGKLVLVMCDGSRVPVSRTYRDRVEARGIGTARAI